MKRNKEGQPSLLPLAPTKLPELVDWEEMYDAYAAAVAEYRAKLVKQHGQSPSPSYTLKIKFDKCGKDERFIEMAQAIDWSGEIELFATCLPRFAAYRRFHLAMPAGKFFSSKTGRLQIREHQRQKGAYMELTICLVNQEQNEAFLRGYDQAMTREGFGQIFPEFGEE